MSAKPSRSVTRVKCVICGRKFKAGRLDARYCSGACRQRAHRARSRLDDLDREIEAARLRYWELIYEKARALGRRPSQIVTDSECQYVDQDGNVWVGGVLGDGGSWRLGGKTRPQRPGFTSWGNEAAGPPWAPPSPPGVKKGYYEVGILGHEAYRQRKGKT